MRRNVLKDYANKVCEMLGGWRLAICSDDIPRLVEIGSRELELDFDCVSTIRTDERVSRGTVRKRERWVGSHRGAPWVVTDR